MQNIQTVIASLNKSDNTESWALRVTVDAITGTGWLASIENHNLMTSTVRTYAAIEAPTIEAALSRLDNRMAEDRRNLSVQLVGDSANGWTANLIRGGKVVLCSRDTFNNREEALGSLYSRANERGMHVPGM